MNRKARRQQAKDAKKANKPAINPQADVGLQLARQGRMDEAIVALKQAVAAQLDHADAHYNLGVIYQGQGNLDQAAGCYAQALAAKPDYFQAHNNLGFVLAGLGRFDEAVSTYHKALAINGQSPDVHNNLGLALQEMGHTQQAVDSYHAALAIDPGFARAHSNLGSALQDMGQLDEALNSHLEALSLEQSWFEIHHNLGNTLQMLGRLNEAVAIYHKALAIHPGHVMTHDHLGNTLKELGRVDEAIDSYKKALAIDPNCDVAAAHLLHLLRHVCAWDDIDEVAQNVRAFTDRSLREGTSVALEPFENIAATPDVRDNYQVARAKSRALEEKMSPQRPDFDFTTRRPPKDKICVGYLSSDYHNHATAHLMLSFFQLHDRDDFNVLNFSHGPNDGSAYRGKIEADSDRFFELRNVSHVQAARTIYQSGVDILVDLKGYTQNNRMEIMALRPAPVQVTYLGFPGTTGGDFMDYILTDAIVTPPDHAPFYSEQPAYLPHTYQVNDFQQKIADVPFTRHQLGLPQEGFVFCSFNNNFKVEPTVFDVWMTLLKKVPNSVLWLFKSNDAAMRNLREAAQVRGIDAHRLVFAEKMPKDQHLARSRLADLCLDTRICGGHTTTSDALWAGVPVVAVKGTHFASRVAASLLSAIDMGELIASNLEDYQALALKLAQSPDELAALKTRLAQNKLSQPLFDTPRFVRNVESAYRSMWATFQSGQPPAPIDVVEE